METKIDSITNFSTEATSKDFYISPFHLIHTQLPDETSPAPSSYTDATPILSPITSDQLDPLAEALEHELFNFITLQNTRALTEALH